MRDNYIIRITNTTLASNIITLNTNKNLAEFEVPNWLRSKGKCNIQVVSSSIAIQNASGTRVLESGENIIAMRTNIPMLGFNTETSGLPNILGTAIVPADTTRVVALDSVAAMEFTCTQLPPVIEIERMTYKKTTPFNLIAADNNTTNVVPFQITLQLSFYEDEHSHN
tara:strand:+ start:3516 stop:4019 length:504 start_codon:yes stop_codon:yes gene_type:complete